MKIWQVVIDTNIIISAIRSKRGASYRLLLSAGEDLRWKMNLSTALLLEYEEKLLEQAPNFGYTQEGIDNFLDYICSIANEPRIYFRWRPFLKDVDDEMILDLAIAANADFIITYNERDFRGIERFGVKVITPFEFLQILGEIK
jgi:putative PIN family toxin of toxin-antitoxin system